MDIKQNNIKNFIKYIITFDNVDQIIDNYKL